MQVQKSSFDSVASVYDQIFTDTKTGCLQRKMVYNHLDRLLVKHKPKRVLELNCGTGADAIWLAKKNCAVLATDISKEMIAVANKKSINEPLEIRKRLSFQTIAIEQINQLAEEGPFDLVFSNFGGINCIAPNNLEKLSEQFKKILSPGGRIVFVIMSRFCWWETAYFLAKANWTQAWRRRSKTFTKAPLAPDVTVKTWYYSPREIMTALGADFQMKNLAPIGFFLPPSYLDPAFKRWPWVLDLLWFFEKQIKNIPFLAAHGDHFLIEMAKHPGRSTSQL